MSIPDLLATLNQTDLQKKDPRLYQVVSGLINQLNGLDIPDAVQKTKFVPVDTSVSAQIIDLNTVVDGFTIIKDKSGNAAVNNITLIGTVDGVVNPVINTNYGELRVYISQGFYHKW